MDVTSTEYTHVGRIKSDTSSSNSQPALPSCGGHARVAWSQPLPSFRSDVVTANVI